MIQRTKDKLNGLMRYWPVLAFIIVYTLGGVWWAAGIDEKVKSQDKMVILELKARDVEIKNLNRGQVRIENKQDKVIDKLEELLKRMP